MMIRKKQEILFAIVLTLGLLFGNAGGQTVSAGKADVKNYTLSGACKSIRSKENSFLYRYTKIAFQRNKVTFQGNLLPIPSEKGKVVRFADGRYD